jgi:hypothetical protein
MFEYFRKLATNRAIFCHKNPVHHQPPIHQYPPTTNPPAQRNKRPAPAPSHSMDWGVMAHIEKVDASPLAVDHTRCALVALVGRPDGQAVAKPGNALDNRIQRAAHLLSAQWPHLGSAASRAQQLRSRAKAATLDALPVSNGARLPFARS